MAAVARELGIPRARIVSWTRRYKAFGDAYKEACELRMLALEVTGKDGAELIPKRTKVEMADPNEAESPED